MRICILNSYVSSDPSPSSSPSSTMSSSSDLNMAKLETLSSPSFLIFISFTPLVSLPRMEISEHLIRITVPAEVISMISSAALCCTAAMGISGNISAEAADIKYEYGVFLGADPEDISDMESYRKIVIDAQYFSKEEISSLKESGHIVYSYINLGSVEEFRPYFKTYEKYSLGVYENWDDERG